MTRSTDAVIVESDLDAAPEEVWRALSEPELLGAWLLPNDIRAEPGEWFTFEAHGAPIDCEVLEAEPGRRLRYSWREHDAGVASTVTFDLTPIEGGGTRLRVVHQAMVVNLADARVRRDERRRPKSMSAQGGVKWAA